jgi:hypothetical protein
MAANAILSCEFLPATFAISPYIGNVVRFRPFLVGYPIVTMELLLVCPYKITALATFAFISAVMYTIVVSSINMIREVQ